MSDSTKKEGTPQSALDIIHQAWKDGRPIVPFFGAGISVGAGFPLTGELREYFCKVLFYIRNGGYQEMLSVSRGQRVPRSFNKRKKETNPAQFLANFGWPDFFRINADLLQIRDVLADGIVSKKPLDDTAFDDWLNLLAYCQQLDPNLAVNEEDLRNAWKTKSHSKEEFRKSAATRYLIDLPFREEWQSLVDDSNHDYLSDFKKSRRIRLAKYSFCVRGSNWADARSTLDAIVQQEILSIMNLEDSDRVNVLEEKVWRGELRLRVDWFRLLLELVEGRMGLADLLFSTLNKNRKPSSGHIAIAHLACRMGWPLILTLNHDTLLERAFQTERLPYKVFDINKDSSLPDSVVVASEWMSLIKLHGSAYGLRLGEPTNLELDIQTRETILSYVPPRALIVVAGFSGYERRMMSLIEAIALRASSDSPRVLWLHQESPDRLPHPVQVLQQKSLEIGDDVFVKEQIQDAGLFFLGAYQRQVSKLPRSHAPYECFPKRLYKTGAFECPSPKDESHQTGCNGDSGHTLDQLDSIVFRPQDDSMAKDAIGTFEDSVRALAIDDYNHKDFLREASTFSKRRVGLSPSLQLSNYVKNFLSEYRVVWIDLEEHHTVSGVVSEIAERISIHDPSIPPVLLPVTDSSIDNIRYGRAIRYLRRALRRGRYAIILDSLEGFGRSQLSHHGLSSVSRQSSNDSTNDLPGVKRLKELQQFLSLFLIRAEEKAEHHSYNIGGSIVLASCDMATLRHPSDSAHKVQNHYAELLKSTCGQFSGLALTKVPNEVTDQQTYASSLPESRKDSNSIDPIEDLDNFGFPSAIANAFGVLAKNSASNSSTDVTADNCGKFITFLVAILFRRPRSITSIRWVMDKVFSQLKLSVAGEFLSNWIDSLSHNGLLQRSEGEFYWIEHHTHETIYRILTQALWEQRLREIGVLPVSSERVEAAAARNVEHKESLKEYTEYQSKWGENFFLSLCIASWNSTIARYHYVHAFQRSGDITALFEYIYHRFSSLRYLWIATNLWREFGKIGFDKDPSIETGIKLIMDFLSQSLEKTNGDDHGVLLQLARERFLRTLINVLEREQTSVFRSATADTWLNWLETINSNLSEVSHPDQGQESESMRNLLRSLRILLLDLRARLYREKGDYRNCLLMRRDLTELLTSKPLATAMNQLFRDVEINVIPVDSLKNRVKKSKTEICSEEILFNTGGDLLGCYRHSREALSHCNDPAYIESIVEALVDSANSSSDLSLRLDGEQIRFEVDDLDLWSSHEPVVDSNQSNHKMNLLDRIEKLEARVFGASFSSEQSFSSLVSLAVGLRGWVHVNMGLIETGKANLTEALNGLRENQFEQQFQIAILRRRLAHALMLEASQKLSSSDGPTIQECDFAEARLREAKQELDVVERLLRQGRRNIRAWKHLYRAKTQLSIEQFLLLIQRIESGCLLFDDVDKLAGRVQELLLSGLDSIRGSLDCTVRERSDHGSGTPASESTRDSNDLFSEQVLKEIEYSVDQWLKLFIVGRFADHNYIFQSEQCGNQQGTETNAARKFNRAVNRRRELNRRLRDGYVARWQNMNDSAGVYLGQRFRGVYLDIADRVLKIVDDYCDSRESDVGSIRKDAIAAMIELRELNPCDLMRPATKQDVTNKELSSSAFRTIADLGYPKTIRRLIAKILFDPNPSSYSDEQQKYG